MNVVELLDCYEKVLHLKSYMHVISVENQRAGSSIPLISAAEGVLQNFIFMLNIG